ncbi:competence protein ComGF [Halobacillus karajensis]|uniref:Competence protein ComGF n=1 Tax=Halobacillus karajensis TaxID=195088 RepID=A0A024P6Q6_9BACI|nr:ComGF family competence protein [Halobacillus karajensis]CDQ17987.1 hypothetical protein BN982_00227 [Halobacillus karajensis]CDQ24336.1 hypothetical protein BN983_02610 [Halobacillus karajensis]CDQ29415.1 hypothetical protein BN981_03796 [Halobacillus karajensis]SEH61461.1 competence protein ComGF [Halobacillus karajensis]
MQRENKRAEEGFTLSEVMISLLVSFTILSLSVPLFSLLKPDDSYSSLSVDQLSEIIQGEINQAQSYTVRNQSISVIDQNQRHISLEFYGTNIRRTVDGSGHEVLIQDVKAISFEQHSFFIVMEVELINEKIYTSKIHLP